MKTIIFDIETGALPKAELEAICPEFEAPKNLKDPEKIAATLAEKRAEWFEKAALSPLTGSVLAVGYIADDTVQYFASGDEREDLTSFWKLLGQPIASKLVGFGSNGFDIPFLVRRSWKLGVRVPMGIFYKRYLSEQCVDLMDLWRCGNRDTYISLDSVSQYLGVGQKNGDGKDFQSLWELDREMALAYLENDLRLIEGCAKKMGAI